VGLRRVCLLGLLAQTAASVPSVRAGEPADPALALPPLGPRRGAYGNLGPGVYLWLRFELEAGASRGPAGGALVAPGKDADNSDSTAGASG
jgi:hypothetical protein